VTLTFDLLTLKVVSESRVSWATSLPIFILLGLSVLELFPVYATDVRQKHRLMPPPLRGEDIIVTVMLRAEYVSGAGSPGLTWIKDR